MINKHSIHTSYKTLWQKRRRSTAMTALPLLSLMIVATLTAATHTQLASAGDYIQRPEAKALMAELQEEHAFKEQELIKIFSKAERKESILEAMQRPAEKTKTWGEYRDIFITPSSIKKGIAFWEKHKASIQEASECYGIPPEIIVAIIGVETRYGQNKGRYRVLDALSTLAFDYPPRSKFFYKELREFILLTRESTIDPLTVKGSYAGAMGFPQFIPSSYRNFSVDFDKSGSTDLINSPKDAIGSVGRYFNLHGWLTGEAVLLPAKPKAKAGLKKGDLDDIANNSLSPNTPFNEIEARGLSIIKTHASGSVRNEDSQKGLLMELEGKNGLEHWVGLHNFYVITRYNHSRLYAMAVYQLGQEIKAQL